MCELPDCGSRRTLAIPSPPRSWTPDGRALAYIDAAQKNVWVQPIDGVPRQLTHFTDGRTIVDFAWSSNGARLAISRSTTTSDVVMFKGLK